MATQEFLGGFGYAILEVVRPLEEAFTSAEAFGTVLLQHGWRPPADQSYLADVQTIFGLTKDIEKVVTLLDDIIATPDISISDVENAVTETVAIITKIR